MQHCICPEPRPGDYAEKHHRLGAGKGLHYLHAKPSSITSRECRELHRDDCTLQPFVISPLVRASANCRASPPKHTCPHATTLPKCSDPNIHLVVLYLLGIPFYSYKHNSSQLVASDLPGELLQTTRSVRCTACRDQVQGQASSQSPQTSPMMHHMFVAVVADTRSSCQLTDHCNNTITGAPARYNHGHSNSIAQCTYG